MVFVNIFIFIMKFSKKEIINIFLILVCLNFGFLFLLVNPQKTNASSFSITGHAKIMNTGNSYLDFTDYTANVFVDDGTGILSGYAFLEDTGWAAFGTIDNALGPVSVNLTTGAVTGKAKVLNTGAYLDFTNYGSNVTVALDTGVFSGYVWSEDVGWVDFTDTGISTTPLAGISTNIVDASFVPVTSPVVNMSNTSLNFNCQNISGTLGTAGEQIYIDNRPAGVTGGWDVTLAAVNPTDVWDGTVDYDFNDPTGSGCTNGQMTVDASEATINYGQDATTDISTGLTKGSTTAFNQGTVDSITLLSGDNSSDENGDWTMQGINISQKIPAEQAVGVYSLQMVLTVTAK